MIPWGTSVFGVAQDLADAVGGERAALAACAAIAQWEMAKGYAVHTLIAAGLVGALKGILYEGVIVQYEGD